MRYVLADGKGMSQIGLNYSNVIGNRLFDDVHERETAEAEKKLMPVFEGESVNFDLHLNTNYYNVSSVPLADRNGEINEILVVIKDISSQKKFEENLVKTIEKEKELNVMKSRFVSMASHEFRTPLTTILSSVFLLENYKGEQLERESNKLLDRIKRAVHNMTEILNEFLSSGKLDEGKMPVNKHAVNLATFLDELRQEVHVLKKDNQQAEFICSGECDEVNTDPQILKNILLNLISNAIKYSKPEGIIKVNTVVTSTEFKISVVDEGMGIPEEEQKYVYQRFFRAHNVSGTQGTGLGLNIVRKYMSLLNGRIEFVSELNKGTTFTVIFPVEVKEAVLN
jgi:signal transduction histidine kinase